jgi:hypothetical protein
MIFVSAGFDAHREDDLGNMGLVEDDYAWLTEQIRARWPSGYANGPDSELSGGRLQPVGAWAQRGRACACAGGDLNPRCQAA